VSVGKSDFFYLKALLPLSILKSSRQLFLVRIGAILTFDPSQITLQAKEHESSNGILDVLTNRISLKHTKIFEQVQQPVFTIFSKPNGVKLSLILKYNLHYLSPSKELEIII